MSLVGYENPEMYEEVSLDPGDHIMEGYLSAVTDGGESKNPDEVDRYGARAKVVLWKYTLDPEDAELNMFKGTAVWDRTTLSMRSMWQYKARVRVYQDMGREIEDVGAIDTDKLFPDGQPIPVTLELRVNSGTDPEGNPRMYTNVRRVHAR